MNPKQNTTQQSTTNNRAKVPVSVLILTRNEEVNIQACLNALDFSDDIVVFDSYSSDQTVAIAQQNNARVVQRKFDNYAAQRNAALNQVKYKNPWIFMIDADEKPGPTLIKEISAIVQAQENNPITLYRMRRKDHFFGKWIKHSSAYPTWFGRLFKAGQVTVQRQINEEYHTNGKIGHLKGHLLHQPFSKGIADWLDRHNKYSSMEAPTLIQEVKSKLKITNLFSSDPTIRRKCLKQIAYRLPFRLTLIFIYLYIFRLGILDGKAGYAYCKLRSMYEYMIQLKIKEIKNKDKNKDKEI